MMENKKEKSLKTGKERALYILQNSDKTEQEIRNKLKQGSYSSTVIDGVIQFLKSYNYIDDVAYTRKYIAYKSKSKSYKLIKAELYQKGIPNEITKEVFDSIDSDENDTIKALINKKKIDWESVGDKDIHKLTNHLLQKGFPYEQIVSVIKEFKGTILHVKN